MDRSVAKSLAWVRANYQLFSITGVSTAQAAILRLKPISELVMSIAIARKFCRGVDLDDIVAWAWAECEQGEVFVRLLMAKPDMYRVLTSIYLFSQFGYENKRLRSLVVSIQNMRVFHSVEADRWVDISTDFAISRYLGTHEDESLYSYSYLFRRPEPWIVSEQSIYAITHEVFYATDFGSRLSFLPVEVQEYLGAWIPVWLEVFVQRGNWDIVGELCMSLAFVGKSDLCALSMQRLRAVQEEDGWVCGPDGAGQQFALAIGDETPTRFFRDYHTTLVAMASFALLADIEQPAVPLAIGYGPEGPFSSSAP